MLLANDKNKGTLIGIISTELACCNIAVNPAKEYDDTLIVKTAVDLDTSLHNPVVVLAQDADILVLFIYHRPNNICRIVTRPWMGGR